MPEEARLLAAAGREPSNPRPYVELGEEAAGTERLATALWAYAEAVVRAPTDSSLRQRQGEMIAQMGQFRAAEAALRAAMSGTTVAAAEPARRDLAELLLTTGRPAAALTMLAGAGPEAEELRGRALEAAGDDTAAAAAYRRAGQQGDPDGFERLARLELASGHLTAAQEAVRALEQVRAARASDMLLIAAIHAAAGTPREVATALARLNVCLQLQPRSAAAHYQAGLLCLRQGDRPAAAEHLDLAVHLDPNNAEARGRLADLLQAMGQAARAHRERAFCEELKDQPDRALAEFRRAGALDPASAPPLSRGEALQQAHAIVSAANETGQRAAVVRQVEDDLKRTPGSVALMMELGMLYREGGAAAPLKRLCREWMALQPHSGMPYWLLGGQALKELRPAEAIGFFQTACDKEPERSDFCVAQGLAYLAAGMPDSLARARSWMERAAALDPQAPAPDEHLGRILEQMGDLDAARRCDLRSLDLQPAQVNVLNHLVRVLERQRHPGAARLFAALARDQEDQTRQRQQLADPVRAQPEQVAPRLELARFLIEHGELAAARNQLERAAEPDSTSGRRALAAVDRLLRVQTPSG